MSQFKYQRARLAPKPQPIIACSACGCMRRSDSPECLGCRPVVYPFHRPLPGLLIKQAG